MRIAVGGFQHETNTFAPLKATMADFEAPDAWPGLVRGGALFDAVHGINLPAAGFIGAARAAGHSLVPLTWCSASPSGPVTEDAFERISAFMLDDLRDARTLDAVYLDLHGAAVAEHLDDADGELLRRVRRLVGRDVAIVASLDFHANVSPLMIESASALVSYRTYPHIDMAITGERALRVLHDIRGRQLHSHLQQLPFLIPLVSQSTLVDPLASIFREAQALESAPIAAFNFSPGFPAADVVKCSPSVFAYGWNAASVDAAVIDFASNVQRREAEFALEILSIDGALTELRRSPPKRGRPTILADTQDNPGGGGNADSTSLIKALISSGQPDVLCGILWDANAAAHAHAAGVGAMIELSLAAHTGFAGETPIRGRFEVISVGDGRFTATGPFYAGARMELGPMALLRIGDVSIAVASRKQQAADQAMFRHLQVEPRDFAVLALKSSVHFRADFGPIAEHIRVVAAPGPNIADPAELPFKRLRPGMRLRPQRN
jgi:microcystin degradation protein MlrC